MVSCSSGDEAMENSTYVSLFQSHDLTFSDRHGEVGWVFQGFQSKANK